MACERSCSVTMSEGRVMSQYYSFVIILVQKARLSALRRGALLIQLCCI